MLLAVLRGAIHLGQGDNRNLQLPRQVLQSPGEPGHLLLTAVAAVVWLDELQIIHEHYLDAMPELQAARVGSDAQHPLARGVVNKQLGALENAAGLNELVHVVGAEMAAAKLMAVHPRLAA